METNLHKYALRRAILRELKRFAGVPVTATELAEISPEPAIRHAVPENVAAEWDELKNMGYLEPIAGFGGAYCKITRRGLEQLSIEFPQDPFVHGPGAQS